MFTHSQLRRARTRRRLSLARAVALLADRGYTTTKATLSNYETAKRTPKADLLAHLAQMYRVDIGFFYSDPCYGTGGPLASKR